MSRKPSTSGPISIKGTRGDDVIRIGEGKYVYSAADQARGFVIDGSSGNDVLAGGTGVDRILGGSGQDDIVAQKEDLLGAVGPGKPSYDGGADQDILHFDRWTENVGIDLGTSDNVNDRDVFHTEFQLVREGVRVQLVGATSHVGLTVSIEGVIGGYGDDYLAGNWNGNYIEGGPGNDYINGKQGRDQLVGGDGDDFIVVFGGDMVSGDYTDSVPVTFPPGARGNDIFSVGGGDAGFYYSNIITDFDTRTDAADLQYDRIWINTNFTHRFVFDAMSQKLKLVWTSPAVGDLGDVVLEGLTEADIPFVPVVYWDPATGLMVP